MLLNVVQVADFLGVSVSTVRRLRAEEKIPQPIQISNKLSWDKQELINFIEEKKKERSNEK